MNKGPADSVILKNMVEQFAQFIEDVDEYGVAGKSRHDGPVLYTSKTTTNGEHIVNCLRHFVAVWRRENNSQTTLDEDCD